MAKRGRPRSYSDETAEAIRKSVADGNSLRETAEKFGLGYETVRRITNPSAYKYWENKERNPLKHRCKTCLNTSKGVAKRHGTTLPTFTWEVPYEAYNGRCAVTGVEESEGNPLHIHHCHKTGRFVAWVLGTINGAMGQLKDDPELAHLVATWMKENH